MPYCPHCRIDVATKDNKCPNCGTILSHVPPIGVQTAKRPMGVTIIGALAALGGIGSLIGGLGLLAIAGYPGVPVYGTSTLPTSLVASAQALGALFVALGVVYFALAWGYFTGKTWAWMVGIAISGVSIAIDIAQAVLLRTAGYTTAVIGILVSVIIIYYLIRPNIKAWFQRK
jgi:hypothetical protein